MNATWFLAGAGALVLASTADGQLFDRLRALTDRVPVGDPQVAAELGIEGPKSIAADDFDRDGATDYAVANSDGTVTVMWGDDAGEEAISQAVHLRTGGVSLRGMAVADFDGDLLPDIAAADPFSGQIFFFFNDGTRSEFAAVPFQTWEGARDLAAEDFDRDGDVDLVVGGINVGLRQYRNDGAAGFEAMGDVPQLDPQGGSGPIPLTYSAKPVFSLRTFLPGDGSAPVLVASHADTEVVFVLQADQTGLLRPLATLMPRAGSAVFAVLHHIELAPVLRPADSPAPDLIGSSKRWNTVFVWRGIPEPPYFEPKAEIELPIARAPRASAAADRNGDGWNDLVIVQREGDAALVFQNGQDGTFAESEFVPLGVSPRDIVTPDYDGDGIPDIVVTNRKSQDVSFVSSVRQGDESAGKLASTVYPTDAEPAGLDVADFNEDGRDDVIQLHRVSGDFSVRFAEEGGSLSDPVFYVMGTLPSQLGVADIDGDGHLDVFTANLGRGSVEGSFAIRHGIGDGTFGPLDTVNIPRDEFSTPGDRSTGIFSIVQADFDGDGISDKAVGYYDCRVGFFRGLPGGSYETLGVHTFLPESRVLITGDFDGDDDIDLAGAGETGGFAVFENEGDLLTVSEPKRFDYQLGGGSKSGVKSAVVTDVNGDGDPDIIIGTREGSFLLFGAEGVTFNPMQGSINGGSAVSSLAMGDFDNDGDADIAVACDTDSTLIIYTIGAGGVFSVALESVAAPSAKFIATGDLDGDGLADLVGTGSVLWAALSGPGPESPPVISALARPRLPHPVINEILAGNDSIPIESDAHKNVDVVEIYHGGSAAADLSGWTLRLEIPARSGEPAETKDFTFPQTSILAAGRRQLVYCSKNLRSAYHTGFKLPREGATLRLIDPAAGEVDRVEYPEQDTDVSYARYGDATASFSFNPFPDPGLPNLDNGGVEPDFSLQTLDPESVAPFAGIRFFADARDDVGIVSLSIVYKRLDVPNQQPVRVPLYDDGAHGDGGRLDGRFAGMLFGLPDGAQIEFYVEAIDLTDQVRVRPDNAAFSAPGRPLRNYSLAIGSPVDRIAPGVEISEVVAMNTRGIADASGELEDWIELRNRSAEPVDLGGLELVQDLFRDSERYAFPAGTVLPPGGYLIVWADNSPDQGPFHAPFRMNASGDETFLVGKTPLDVTGIVSSLISPPLDPDRAYARLGSGSFFIESDPSPGDQNLSADLEIAYVPALGASPPKAVLFFRTRPGAVHLVEGSENLAAWTTIGEAAGNGVEQSITAPADGARRYFRIRER